MRGMETAPTGGHASGVEIMRTATCSRGFQSAGPVRRAEGGMRGMETAPTGGHASGVETMRTATCSRGLQFARPVRRAEGACAVWKPRLREGMRAVWRPCERRRVAADSNPRARYGVRGVVRGMRTAPTRDAPSCGHLAWQRLCEVGVVMPQLESCLLCVESLHLFCTPDQIGEQYQCGCRKQRQQAGSK